MLRHIVLLTFQDSATPEVVEDITARLRDLPEQIPDLLRVDVGQDAGLTEGNADLLLDIEVADVDAWRAYQGHPAHRAVIVDHIGPILASRVAIQVETLP